MLKRLLTYICVCYTWLNAAHAQNAGLFRKELSFTTENDAYLFQKKDAYYTNGVFLGLTKAGTYNGGKLIHSYQAGQMIYTPLSRKVGVLEDIDRPYCGLLFIKYSQTRFHKNGSLFQYSAGISELGPASLGEGLQNSYHKLLGYSRFNGWQYQVQNALGVDFGAAYARTLLVDSAWIKIIPKAQVNLGTTFINASFGIYTVLGSFEKNSNSALWNARVQTAQTVNRRKYELFVYWYPQVIWQGYNGTIEGGLLNKGNGAVLGSTEKWMFQQAIGLCYAGGRWTTHAAWIYQTREAVSQIRAQQYGSLSLSYRMH